MKYITELPIYNIRVTYDNINNNDIVTLKIDNKRKYCLVIGKTDTMIKIKNLDIEITHNKIIFNENDLIDKIAKNYISFTREIYKLENIIHNQ